MLLFGTLINRRDYFNVQAPEECSSYDGNANNKQKLNGMLKTLKEELAKTIKRLKKNGTCALQAALL